MEHLKHLHKDKVFKKATSHLDVRVLKPVKHLHLELCTSVISQQLSTKVAAVIQQRFFDLFDEKFPTPESVLSVEHDRLKSIGLSQSKTFYIHNICQFFSENKLTDRRLHKMNDEELMQTLVQIKGIGKWSVEMLMIFAMARPDVFSCDDLGIQKAMTTIYGLDATNAKLLKVEMGKIAEKWTPYRTYACLYLWAWYNDQKTSTRK